jgi:hypothetical protein
MGGARIEYDVVPERLGKDDAVGYLDGKIDLLRKMAINRPNPSQALSDRDVIQWNYKFLSFYGKVLGNLECLGNFGIFPIEMVKKYEMGIKTMLQFYISAVMIGNQ